MNRDEILQQIMDSGALPTLSNVASKLIEITGRDDTTIYEITQLIAQDVSLSAKVLKVVNSAFYSFPNEVRSIQQAVAILGTNAVRSLVLSFSFLSMEKKRRQKGFDYQRFWEQSLATAVAAKLLVGQVETRIDPEEVFTVSLLVNIGVLILAQAFPGRYDGLLQQADCGSDRLIALEEKELGIDHTYVGSRAARHWQFPETLVLPILYHHAPEDYAGEDGELAREIRIVYLADLIANILYSSCPIDFADRFRKEAKRLLNLPGTAIDAILENVSAEVAGAADYFGLKIEGTPSIPEILQKANIELSLLNMSYEQMNRELVAAKLELERLNAELQEKNAYLEEIANLDGLTGVRNHRYFQEHLEREINRTIRGGHPLGLVMIDLDRFKKINDVYGHQAGDFVLREVCDLWRELVRDYDLLARYGGEEFVLVLPETDAEQALAVAEKLRAATAAHTFDNQGERYTVTASFGVSVFDPADREMDKNRLIEQADSALYEAKKKGRNRIEFYAPRKKGGWLRRLKA